MGLVRGFVRQVLANVGRVVQKNDLFERPGERPRSSPLPRAAQASPAAAPVVATPAPSPTPASEPVSAPVAPPPAAVVAPAVAPVAAEASPAPKAAKGKAGRAAPARPSTGCAPVDTAGLLAALTPSGKPLVVNHWATWCDPCVEELPRLVRSAAGLGDVAELLGVSWDLFDHPGDAKKVAKKVGAFADSVGVGYPSVLYTGQPQELFDACKLDYELIPQTLVIAPDGTVVYHHKGMLTDDDVFPLIRAAKAAAGKGT